MKWYLQNPTRIYLVWWLVRLGILHKSCACTTLQPHSVGDLWVEQQQWSFLLSSLLKWIVLFRNHAPVKDCYWSNHPTCLSVLDDHCAGIQLARKLTYSLYWDDLPSVSAIQCFRAQIQLTMPQSHCLRPICGECSDEKRNLLFSANNVQQTMCTIIVWDMIYISWFIKKTDCKGVIFYPSPAFGWVRWGCECHTVT